MPSAINLYFIYQGSGYPSGEVINTNDIYHINFKYRNFYRFNFIGLKTANASTPSDISIMTLNLTPTSYDISGNITVELKSMTNEIGYRYERGCVRKL